MIRSPVLGRSLFPSVLIILLLAAGCGDDEMMGGGGGGSGNLSDPDAFEAEMRATFVPAALGVFDGFARLVTAINGGAQDGVTLVPDGSGGFDATVDVDLDGNGSRETTINGGFVDPMVTIDGVDDPSLPSLSVGASGRVTTTGATTVLLDQMSGSLSADPPGPMNAADATITGGAVSVDLATTTPSGSMSAAITGEGETLDVSVTFQSDGAGGWEVRFLGTDFDFTIP